MIPSGQSNKTFLDKKLVLEDYYRAGGHTYEIPRGRGLPRAVVCFEETPRGDGAFLREEHNGAEELQEVLFALEFATCVYTNSTASRTYYSNSPKVDQKVSKSR